ncbi:MAG: flavodoxin-dependent (E)-4-hydroxy-3-methylbut-2-enyl-diphosphate synthase, partial [Planctomycetia bacterium]|nr:flavodoxin-dependent (E)-4-hydroxy-3-methylbut-2-enyl-diphosphate synthase [Planctomycetia bacterium]
QGTASRMVALLMECCEFCDSCGFTELVLSAKSSDAVATMDAYRELSGRVDYPLHLGITAAGLPAEGRLKSGIVIGGLLAEGIGDTIRVSLTGDPVEEVSAAKEILATLGLRQREGIEIISCPTCGRCEVDLASIVRAVKRETRDIKAPMQVAVMGCVVNGPGEAREADVGVAACDRDSWTLFCRGRRVRKVPQDRLLKELLAEVRRLANLPS